jgi:Zn-dependent peptidase ImmA (M78 family)
VNRFAYYEQMKALARQVRQEHHLATARVLRSDLRRLYRAYDIKIDLWPYKFKSLRGAYFYDELGPTVVLARHLPPEPLIFTMAHELKHHLVDRGQVLAYCDTSNIREPIEIGAEIFAAELIFPEEDFINYLKQMGVGPRQCTPEVVVRLKQETQTTLSYAGLAKRAEFFNFARPGSLAKVQWKKLEEQLYGEPIYKRLHRHRQALPGVETPG